MPPTMANHQPEPPARASTSGHRAGHQGGPAVGFDQRGGGAFVTYDPADRESVLRHAQRLVGRTVSDISNIAAEAGATWDEPRGKGAVGLRVERYFGIEANVDAGPDLTEAGIEIKSVPMKVARKGKTAKERTSITMIDFHRVVEESFEGSALDLKTRLTLYVFYLWSADGSPDPTEQRFLRVLMHDRDGIDLLALASAYDHVQARTRAGEAHLLSEGDTSPVGACTKGAKGQLRKQPFSAEPARSRAFAWRPAYTTRLFRTDPSNQHYFSDQVPSSLDELARQITIRIAPTVGRSVEEVRMEAAPNVSPRAKNVAAATFRRLLASTPIDLVSTLDGLGTSLRVIRVDPSSMRPREAVSFAPFEFTDVAATPWEESEVLAALGRVLFIVLDSRAGAAVTESRVRGSFLWTADPDTVATMKSEYERFRRAFVDQPPRSWPKARETRVLHVRPHGRNRHDVLPLPSGGTHVRSSFWFNQTFVQRLVIANLG